LTDQGAAVTLNGWVHRLRDHGGITFISLRDRYGVTQVVVDADAAAGLKAEAASLKMEWCLAVEGTVRGRPETMRNPDMATGDIEVAAATVTVLTKSEVLPFMLDEVQKDGTPVVPNAVPCGSRSVYLDLRLILGATA